MNTLWVALYWDYHISVWSGMGQHIVIFRLLFFFFYFFSFLWFDFYHSSFLFFWLFVSCVFSTLQVMFFQNSFIIDFRFDQSSYPCQKSALLMSVQASSAFLTFFIEARRIVLNCLGRIPSTVRPFSWRFVQFISSRSTGTPIWTRCLSSRPFDEWAEKGL